MKPGCFASLFIVGLVFWTAAVCFAVHQEEPAGSPLGKPAEPAAGAAAFAGRSLDELLLSIRELGLAGRLEEREQAIEAAVALAGTGNSELNSLRGLVFENGRWQSAEEVAAGSRASAILRTYGELRGNCPDTLEGQLELAQWCARNALPDQSRAHLLYALAFDPENETVRRGLGHVLVGGRWLTGEEIRRETEFSAAARNRFGIWQEPVARIHGGLQAVSKKKRAAAMEELRAIDDPAAVTAVEVILGQSSEEIALVAMDWIAALEEAEASHSLLRLALDSPSAVCREKALDLLAQRDPFDYVPGLISQLSTPATSEFAMVTDSNGNVLHRHVFRQQTAESDHVRQYDSLVLNGGVQDGPGTGPVRPNLRANADQRAALATVAAAGRDARQMEDLKDRHNAQVEALNRRIGYILTRTQQVDCQNDPAAWWQWWYDYNEVYFSERPVSYRYQSQGRQNNAVPLDPRTRIGGAGCECLIAGTPVCTDRGPVAIESIRTGDRVLTRETATGRLEYRPVIRPTVRPATPTVRIFAVGEVIEASGGHPFWVSGSGWVKARDLVSGMQLSTVSGLAPVSSVEPGKSQVLYNLIVDGNSNYFAGALKILSHDNTIRSRGSRTIANRMTR